MFCVFFYLWCSSPLPLKTEDLTTNKFAFHLLIFHFSLHSTFSPHLVLFLILDEFPLHDERGRRESSKNKKQETSEGNQINQIKLCLRCFLCWLLFAALTSCLSDGKLLEKLQLWKLQTKFIIISHCLTASSCLSLGEDSRLSLKTTSNAPNDTKLHDRKINWNRAIIAHKSVVHHSAWGSFLAIQINNGPSYRAFPPLSGDTDFSYRAGI